MMKTPFVVFQTKLGWMGLVGSDKGVTRIYLPEPSRADLLHRIYREFPGCQEGSELLAKAKKEIIEYFDGQRSTFDMPLDLSSATPFVQAHLHHMATDIAVPVVVISPATSARPVVTRVSHATRLMGSCAMSVSSTASEI